MAADLTSTGTVSYMDVSFPVMTTIEDSAVVISDAPVFDLTFGDGGGTGSSRPTTGFLYPRGQG